MTVSRGYRGQFVGKVRYKAEKGALIASTKKSTFLAINLIIINFFVDIKNIRLSLPDLSSQNCGLVRLMTLLRRCYAGDEWALKFLK